jgi:SsrA-binding protein
MPTLATNPRAAFDYDLLEKYEGGLMLTGAEVRSIRLGHVTLKGAFMTLQHSELYLKHAHISPYAPAGTKPGYDPKRDRKVLVHNRQLKEIIGKHEADGLTIVPISLYTKANLIKVSFAIARGKKKFEKRETIRRRELDREARAEMKRAR